MTALDETLALRDKSIAWFQRYVLSGVIEFPEHPVTDVVSAFTTTGGEQPRHKPSSTVQKKEK